MGVFREFCFRMNSLNFEIIHGSLSKSPRPFGVPPLLKGAWGIQYLLYGMNDSFEII